MSRPGACDVDGSNAFDLTVTVAHGSTLATMLSVHTKVMPALVKSEPTLLVFRGVQLDEGIRARRVSEEEVLRAVRNDGFASVSDVHAVVLETDGSFSVIRRASTTGDSALRNVSGWRG